MNVVRRFAAFVHGWILELLLGAAAVLLAAQLLWPTIHHWWRLPAAGQVGFDTYAAPTLADEFVVQLPTGYYHRQSWPLVVFLHGSGERGNDASILRKQELFRQRLPAIVVAPQCVPSNSWEPDTVINFIRHMISQYRADARRIYLVGYSMGGYGTWATAAAQPEMFAAIVPIAGGGHVEQAKSLAAIPIWAFHGENDKVVPVDQTQQMIEAIRSARGQPKETILSEEGHGICKKVCERADLWQWLLAQQRPTQ